MAQRKRNQAKQRRSGGRAADRRPQRARPRRWLRTLALLIAGAAFGGGWVVADWLSGLDRIVRERFEGQRRFQLPSRVFAAPMLLHPGLDWKLIELRELLRRRGYRETRGDGPLPKGKYRWTGDRLRIHLHDFEHPSRPEPAREVELDLVGDVIEEIRQLPSGRELFALLLEPEEIGAYYGPHREQRELIEVAELPPHMIDAVLAVEDQRFESHAGIDPRRIAGALIANLRAGSIQQGGSTLTQQLVKNFFLTPERTYKRKLQEAAMALLVELHYSKDEILQTYLNEIYLGQRGATALHGIGEAARVYFGKPARDLSLAESALLAAMIQSPNKRSPYRAAERALERRDLVLDLMLHQGRIDEAAHAEAKATPLELAALTPDASEARYFLDLLRRQLADVYDAEVLSSEGLRIYSTLDPRAQKLGAAALRRGIESLEERFPKLRAKEGESAKALQGCLVALRPQSGEILALVGGRQYGSSQFDRCTQARRQTGSVFKPFVYLAGLEARDGGPTITLASFVDDTPFELRTPSGPWRPQNFDREFHGRVPVREALERSLNVATARLASEIGIERVVDVAHRLGIESPLPALPSVALGAGEVSPLEMARAYATVAGGGLRPALQSIEDLVDREGHTLGRRQLQNEQVIDAGSAFLLTSMLEGVAERGTARGVRSGGLAGPIAAKTGTSNDEIDLWFVGFTPDLVVVVWLGFDRPRSLGVPSSVGALPVWRDFVSEYTGGEIHGAFPRPPEIEELEIDPYTGGLALFGCPAHRPEYFLAGTRPESSCPPGALLDAEAPSRPAGSAGAAGSDAGAAKDGEPSPPERFFDWLRRHL